MLDTLPVQCLFSGIQLCDKWSMCIYRGLSLLLPGLAPFLQHGGASRVSSLALGTALPISEH